MQGLSESGEQGLLVRVWGLAGGRAFFQNVYARDLRMDGALLSGIEYPLAPEDVIGVQYEGKKARCRVQYVNDTGLPHLFQAEVQILSDQECPWKELLETANKPVPPPPPPPAVTTSGDSNKRQFPRHKVRFPIVLRDERGGPAMQTNSSDISGRGCYVETLIPLPLGTKLTVVFWIESEKITCSAHVRSSDPGVGMGIEFVGLDQKLKERFQELLRKMAAQTSAGATAF